jgi:hypothetical protein
MENVFVDREALLTLKRTQNLIEELLETIDVLADKNAVKALKESAADKKAGRVRPLQKFLAETNVQD